MSRPNAPLLVTGQSLVLLGMLVACGDAPPKPVPQKDPPATQPDAPAKTTATPPAAGSTSGGGSGTTVADPFATGDDWAEPEAATVALGEDSGGSESGGEPAPPPLFDGPCYVRWSKGPVLRFRYAKNGNSGWLRIDGDNDGRNDVCSKFWLKEGRTNKVTVDEGCDKETDAVISPSYDGEANVATATYTDKRGESETKQEITLITLPAFTGVAPGYPLYAAKDKVDFTIEDGRVTKAVVKEPIEGPAVKVSLRYDDDGRVTRIDEDHKADGKLDRRYSYRYDEVGNVTGITLSETDYSEGKANKSKKTAKLGYSCWSPD